MAQRNLTNNMKFYIFGNIDLPNDSLPLRILPELEEKFPEIDFYIKDPNEDWVVEDHINIIDTVVGIDDVTIFDGLEKFSAVSRVSVHDFDALTNLRLLQKLGKIKSVKIIGLPGEMAESEALKKVSALISQ
jgi:hypothetical protein